MTNTTKKSIILFTLLIFNFVFAQQLPVLSTTSFANPNDDLSHAENGNYAIDIANERDQYVGTWEYNQNGTLFQVKIEKIDQYLNRAEYSGNIISYTYSDVVTFKYKLIKNGVTIYDNLNTTFTPNDLVPTAFKKSSNTYLYGGFLDYTGGIMASIRVTNLNTTPEKINFYINPMGYYYVNPIETYAEGQQLFYIPIGTIEMVKIN